MPSWNGSPEVEAPLLDLNELLVDRQVDLVHTDLVARGLVLDSDDAYAREAERYFSERGLTIRIAA